MRERDRKEREILRALAESAEREPPRELDAFVRGRLAERRADPLLAALEASAELAPPESVESAVRARLLAWRPVRRRVPTLLPLGVAAASVVTLFAGLAGSLGQGGQTGYEGAAIALSAYLALSAVAALPILLVTRRRPAPVPREVRP